MNSSAEKEQNIGACVFLLHSDQQQILLERRKGGYKAGYFGAPGGHLNVGEALEACARRELFEETGVIARQLQYVGCVRDWQGEFDFFHFVFVCSDYSNTPQLKEPEKGEGWSWYPTHQLPFPVLPGHAAGITFLNHTAEISFLIDLHKQ